MQSTIFATRRDGVPEISGGLAQRRSDPTKTGHGTVLAAAVKSVPLAMPDMASQIDQALRSTGYLGLRDLRIRVAEGLVVLRGRVRTYHLKQVAQAVALGIRGVKEVQNDIDVVSVYDFP